MATFFMFGKYSPQAVDKITSDRTKKATDLVRNCGGEIKEIYALLGEHDLVLITEFADIESAMKASIDVGRMSGIGFVTAPAVAVERFDQLVGIS